MFDLKKGREEDIDTMLSMTKEFYGDIEISNKDFIKWQYFRNLSGDAYIRIAYIDNEPAGQYIIIPMRIKIDNEIINCTLSLNTLTREKFRGKKVFTILAEQVYDDCKKNGAKFTYGFPNQNSYNGFIKKLNFKDIGSLPLLIRPLSFKNILKLKTQNSVISFFGAFVDSFLKNDTNNCDDIIEIDKSNCYIFDTFWQDIKNEYPIIGVRDSLYIKWRYLDIPIREYKIIGIKDVDKLVCYAILRNTTIDNYKCGMLVDFLYMNGYEKQASKLLECVTSEFMKSNMDMIGCLVNSNTKEYKLLKKNKFFKVPKKFEPQPFPVILRIHDDSFYISDSIKDWFLTMGDYDVI
ncbi:GNAT family N-acetyltransferase [Peptoanaerobacter stomatis]|uniref:GNAT family N-acetyltransferase n=1 Tax=Peptoanaerobacter stomatis TaxID=796937 RepID=UPI003F9FB2A8